MHITNALDTCQYMYITLYNLHVPCLDNNIIKHTENNTNSTTLITALSTQIIKITCMLGIR